MPTSRITTTTKNSAQGSGRMEHLLVSALYALHHSLCSSERFIEKLFHISPVIVRAPCWLFFMQPYPRLELIHEHIGHPERGRTWSITSRVSPGSCTER
jgi:hypothetical protein